MTDNDLIRVIHMTATEAEYGEYARLLAAACKAVHKVAECAAMLVAKYSPELIGWGEEFERMPEGDRIRAAGRSQELISRVTAISGQLQGLVGRGKPSAGCPAKDNSAKKA